LRKYGLDKETAPAAVTHPEAPDQEELLLIKQSLQRNAVKDELKRTVLREAQDRYLRAVMNDDERLVVIERIKRLRLDLGL
jgi:hypothetical protein